MISHEYKFIYLHPPKTAGTSIERSLSNLCEYHTSKHQYMCYTHYCFDNCGKDKKRFNEYFKFCSVRNPWERMFSFYKFYNNIPFGSRRDASKSQFTKFVKDVFTLKDRAEVQNVIDFCSIVEYPSKGNKNFLDTISQETKIAVDFFIRFEKLQEDFDYACERIGIEKRKLPHSYRTKKLNYVDFYEEDIIEKVGMKFKKDIDYFGYNFE